MLVNGRGRGSCSSSRGPFILKKVVVVSFVPSLPTVCAELFQGPDEVGDLWVTAQVQAAAARLCHVWHCARVGGQDGTPLPSPVALVAPCTPPPLVVVLVIGFDLAEDQQAGAGVLPHGRCFVGSTGGFSVPRTHSVTSPPPQSPPFPSLAPISPQLAAPQDGASAGQSVPHVHIHVIPRFQRVPDSGGASGDAYAKVRGLADCRCDWAPP